MNESTTPNRSDHHIAATAYACALHGIVGTRKPHDGCVHCELAQVKAERDGALLTIERMRDGFAEASNVVGELAREDVQGDDGAVRYADLRLIFARAQEVLDA